MATVARFAAELLIRTTAARLRYGRFAMLSDSTEYPVQSATVSAYFERIMARGIDMDIGPCAIVVGSYLNKVQAERIFDNDRVKVFIDGSDAASWLTDNWQ